MSQNQSAMQRIASTPVGLFVGLTAVSIAAMNVATAATDSASSYYTLGSFQCSYNGATATDCSTSAINVTAPGSGANSVSLLIGATLTVASASIADGADNGSFDVVVAYQ